MYQETKYSQQTQGMFLWKRQVSDHGRSKLSPKYFLVQTPPPWQEIESSKSERKYCRLQSLWRYIRYTYIVSNYSKYAKKQKILKGMLFFEILYWKIDYFVKANIMKMKIHKMKMKFQILQYSYIRNISIYINVINISMYQ